MIALPFSPSATSAAAAAAFVYEGDRMSGAFRLPNSAPPFTRSGSVIAVTNHYLNYGFDPAFPFRNFGVDILSPRAPGGDFSTLWRYAAVSAAVVARDDAAAADSQSSGVARARGGITFDDVRSMLQGAAHRKRSTPPPVIFLQPQSFNHKSQHRPAASPRTPPAPPTPLTHAASAASHGATEHAIITRAHEGQVDLWLAVADMDGGGWNAPYASYTRLKWREIFS
jgi:hypothetical protein